MPKTVFSWLTPLSGFSGVWQLVLLVAVLLAAACFAGFAWAIRGHFRQHGRMPGGMRIVSLLSALGFVWFLVDGFVDPRPPAHGGDIAVVLAVILFVFALFIFWWSIKITRTQPLTLAFAADVPRFLQHRGPYNYVRHPFYLSYLAFWIGTALASGDILHWVMPLVMGVLYVAAARREERKFDQSTLASAYRAYRQRTGMLVPRLRRQPDEA
jgi:protein-S-isoprenylcysteine O-methyltransferase Ste14